MRLDHLGPSRIQGSIAHVDDRAGYLRAVANASHFVVCPDSITMISECCSLNRAVYVLSMDTVSADTERTRLIEQFLDSPDLDLKLLKPREITNAEL